MKLIINIPKDYYEIIKHEVEHNLTDYRPLVIIGNGIPLDDVKQEIWVTDFDFGDYYDHTAEIQDKVCEILDNIGKGCNTCKNNDDEFSGECYECVKNIQNHYEPKGSEE